MTSHASTCTCRAACRPSAARTAGSTRSSEPNTTSTAVPDESSTSTIRQRQTSRLQPNCAARAAASSASSSIPRQKMRFPGDCCGSIHPWYSGMKRVVVPKKEAAARQAGRFISHREAPGFAAVNPSILPFPLNTV